MGISYKVHSLYTNPRGTEVLTLIQERQPKAIARFFGARYHWGMIQFTRPVAGKWEYGGSPNGARLARDIPQSTLDGYRDATTLWPADEFGMRAEGRLLGRTG